MKKWILIGCGVQIEGEPDTFIDLATDHQWIVATLNELEEKVARPARPACSRCDCSKPGCKLVMSCTCCVDWEC